MVSGWFVFALVASIVVCSGFILAIALMRAAWAQRERESLTATDLRALEESAVMLIEQLKSEAEASITELDKRRKALSKLIKEADTKLKSLAEAQAETRPALKVDTVDDSSSEDNGNMTRILELIDTGMEPSDISKTTGIDCAEVNFVLSLNRSLAA